MLAALAVGYEITARIEAGLMLASAVTLQGFRHSWPGVFGAAVATAKLMGLPVNGIMDTLALVSTLAVPGTMAWYCNWADAEEADRLGSTGVTERYLQLGANAKNAVLAASLAEARVPRHRRGARGRMRRLRGVRQRHGPSAGLVVPAGGGMAPGTDRRQAVPWFVGYTGLLRRAHRQAASNYVGTPTLITYVSTW